MTENLWFFAALSAAILWAISYTVSEVLLKEHNLGVGTIMMFTQVVTLPVWLIIGLSSAKFGQDWATITSSSWVIPAMIVLCAFTCVLGNHLTMFSISQKNATLASMIEISYPFFVALFGWFIFKEAQINWWTGLGGLMIFSGIAVIYLKS